MIKGVKFWFVSYKLNPKYWRVGTIGDLAARGVQLHIYTIRVVIELMRFYFYFWGKNYSIRKILIFLFLFICNKSLICDRICMRRAPNDVENFFHTIISHVMIQKLLKIELHSSCWRVLNI